MAATACTAAARYDVARARLLRRGSDVAAGAAGLEVLASPNPALASEETVVGLVGLEGDDPCTAPTRRETVDCATTDGAGGLGELELDPVAAAVFRPP